MHRCVCPNCCCRSTVNASVVPCGAICALGAAVARKNPSMGAVIVGLGIVFRRELDRFFRYRCPRCGVALQILVELA